MIFAHDVSHMGPPLPSVGLAWCAAFAVNAIIVAAASLSALRRIARGRVYWVDGLSWLVFVGVIGGVPSRVIGSYIMYGALFREGVWPIIWIVVYAALYAEAVKFFGRRWDISAALFSALPNITAAPQANVHPIAAKQPEHTERGLL